jgi:hypothetical protein
MAAFVAFVGVAVSHLAAVGGSARGGGGATTTLPFIRTSETDSHFYDEFRRVRIFHGSNRVQKGEPWYFPDLVDPLSDEAERIASLGFNVVRLGWMWTGFNPAPNVFNMTYASEVLRTVQQLADHGVYTLLDTHQARYGRNPFSHREMYEHGLYTPCHVLRCSSRFATPPLCCLLPLISACALLLLSLCAKQ